MRSKIVRIGNSRGIRLPKTMLAEAGLAEEVEIRAQKGAIIISAPPRPVRAGWTDEAKKMRERGDDLMLDPPTPTRFDDEDWDW